MANLTLFSVQPKNEFVYFLLTFNITWEYLGQSNFLKQSFIPRNVNGFNLKFKINIFYSFFILNETYVENNQKI